MNNHILEGQLSVDEFLYYCLEIGDEPEQIEAPKKKPIENRLNMEAILNSQTPTYIVYETTNSVNDIKYIGCFSHNPTTPGTSVYHTYIGSGIHQSTSSLEALSTPFAEAVREIGFKNFTRKDLFTFKNRDKALAKERELIQNSKSELYNLIHDEKSNLDPIYVYTKDLEFFRKYQNHTLAAEDLKMRPAYIIQNINQNDYRSLGGYCFFREPLTTKEINTLLTEKQAVYERMCKGISKAKQEKHHLAKPSIDTETGKEYPSLKEAVTANGFNYSTVYHQIRNGRKCRFKLA